MSKFLSYPFNEREKWRKYIEDTIRIKNKKDGKMGLAITFAILQLEFPHRFLGFEDFETFMRALNIVVPLKEKYLTPEIRSKGYQLDIKVEDPIVWVTRLRQEKGILKWMGYICNTLCVGVEFENQIGTPFPLHENPLEFPFVTKHGYSRIVRFSEIRKLDSTKKQTSLGRPSSSRNMRAVAPKNFLRGPGPSVRLVNTAPISTPGNLPIVPAGSLTEIVPVAKGQIQTPSPNSKGRRNENEETDESNLQMRHPKILCHFRKEFSWGPATLLELSREYRKYNTINPADALPVDTDSTKVNGNADSDNAEVDKSTALEASSNKGPANASDNSIIQSTESSDSQIAKTQNKICKTIQDDSKSIESPIFQASKQKSTVEVTKYPRKKNLKERISLEEYSCKMMLGTATTTNAIGIPVKGQVNNNEDRGRAHKDVHSEAKNQNLARVDTVVRIMDTRRNAPILNRRTSTTITTDVVNVTGGDVITFENGNSSNNAANEMHRDKPKESDLIEVDLSLVKVEPLEYLDCLEIEVSTQPNPMEYFNGETMAISDKVHPVSQENSISTPEGPTYTFDTITLHSSSEAPDFGELANLPKSESDDEISIVYEGKGQAKTSDTKPSVKENDPNINERSTESPTSKTPKSSNGTEEKPLMPPSLPPRAEKSQSNSDLLPGFVHPAAVTRQFKSDLPLSFIPPRTESPPSNSDLLPRLAPPGAETVQSNLDLLTRIAPPGAEISQSNLDLLKRIVPQMSVITQSRLALLPRSVPSETEISQSNSGLLPRFAPQGTETSHSRSLPRETEISQSNSGLLPRLVPPGAETSLSRSVPPPSQTELSHSNSGLLPRFAPPGTETSQSRLVPPETELSHSNSGLLPRFLPPGTETSLSHSNLLPRFVIPGTETSQSHSDLLPRFVASGVETSQSNSDLLPRFVPIKPRPNTNAPITHLPRYSSNGNSNSTPANPQSMNSYLNERVVSAPSGTSAFLQAALSPTGGTVPQQLQRNNEYEYSAQNAISPHLSAQVPAIYSPITSLPFQGSSNHINGNVSCTRSVAEAEKRPQLPCNRSCSKRLRIENAAQNTARRTQIESTSQLPVWPQPIQPNQGYSCQPRPFSKIRNILAISEIAWLHYRINLSNIESTLRDRKDVVEKYHPPVNPRLFLTCSEVTRYCGFHGDNGFIESMLFAMFFFTDMFDQRMLIGNANCYKRHPEVTRPFAQDIQRYIRDSILGSLRNQKFVTRKDMVVLMIAFKRIQHLNHLVTVDEHSYEKVVLYTLFSAVYDLKEFLTCSINGHNIPDYVYNIEIPLGKDRYQFTSVQNLFDLSFAYSRAKLSGIPVPALILKMPKGMNGTAQFKVVVPNLILDITDVLTNVQRQCYLCGDIATQECLPCVDEGINPNAGMRSTAYCDSCCRSAHSLISRQRHISSITAILPFSPTEPFPLRNYLYTQNRINLKLWAIICLRSENYFVYIRTGNDRRNDRWLRYQSQSFKTSEFPEITVMPKEFGDCLSKFSDDANLNELRENFPMIQFREIREMLCSVHYCIYYSQEKKMEEKNQKIN